MRIIVTGSIAMDHLMTFQGRFSDALVSDQLDNISLSFLTDGLIIRHGGVAANVALGMARLGLSPVLAAAAGQDFSDYGARLAGNGVDTRFVYISQDQFTARFVCTTDAAQNQIASFYPGAMGEAAKIKLSDLGPFDLALIGPNDPAAMLAHTSECQGSGYRFAADPSQQLARMDGADIRALVAGAAYLFTNEYEHALLLQKTGWTNAEVLDRVSAWVTTSGASGIRIERAAHARSIIPAIPASGTLEPTGVGDGFRAGFLAGIAHGLAVDDAARVGCALATLVLESDGPQEYELRPAAFASRLAGTYGQAAASRIAARLSILAESSA
ncbi:MAG: carbohydrate kinase family protein [Streptosporangiaceae bacterium]